MKKNQSLYGLVLVGGRSTRMKKEKSALVYHDAPQCLFCHDLLCEFCDKVFVSCRKDQAGDDAIKDLPQIHDRDEFTNIGPMGGILSAMHAYPDAAWLVLACDLPYVKKQTLTTLIQNRDPQRIATAYKSVHDNLPEPLCAIYEPHGAAHFLECLNEGIKCPRKALINSDVKLLEQSDKIVLENVNTPDEFKAALKDFPPLPIPPWAGKGEGAGKVNMDNEQKTISLHYYAALREQRGCSTETIITSAPTAGKVYDEIQARHGFTLTSESLRVAVNDEFKEWDAEIKSGDTIVFIPPVAGGQ